MLVLLQWSAKKILARLSCCQSLRVHSGPLNCGKPKTAEAVIPDQSEAACRDRLLSVSVPDSTRDK